MADENSPDVKPAREWPGILTSANMILYEQPDFKIYRRGMVGERTDSHYQQQEETA
jgi:hypothetical protein